MPRRVQLAVVAHIRHLYTDYDRLLKVKSFHEARSAVEQSTLAKVIAWRGDDENGQTVLEDVFREVIVISDDEDSETEEQRKLDSADTGDQDGGTHLENSRAHEIHASSVNATELSNQVTLRDSSEELQTGFKVIPSIPARKTIDRRGFSRYQAWNRALTRYRAGTLNVDPARRDDDSAEQQRLDCTKRTPSGQKPMEPISRMDGGPPHTNIVRGSSQPPGYRNKTAQVPAASAADGLIDRHVLVPQKNYFGGEDRRNGSQYGLNRKPLALTGQKSPEVAQREEPPLPSTGSLMSGASSYYGVQRANAPSKYMLSFLGDKNNVPVFVRGPQDMLPRSEIQVGQANRVPLPPRPQPAAISQDHVLPSVETPWSLENRPVESHLEHLTERMSLRSITPVRRTIQADSASQNGSLGDQNPKRRRLDYDTASYHNNRSMARNLDAAGQPFREEQSPKGPRCNTEISQEPRFPDRAHLNPDYAPALDSSLRVGTYRARPPVSQVPPQVNVHSKSASGQRYSAVSYPQAFVHHAQPRHLGASSSHVVSGCPVRATGVPPLNLPSAHGSNLSSSMERAPPPLVARASGLPRKPPFEGSRIVNAASSSGQLYADDFVRHVDIQDPQPVQRYVKDSRSQAQHVEDTLSKSSKAAAPEHSFFQSPSQAQYFSVERCQSPTSRGTTHSSHHRVYCQPEAISDSYGRANPPESRQSGCKPKKLR